MIKPTISREDACKMLTEAYPGLLNDPMIVFGLRGYFDVAGQNKRGIYDDCIGIITPLPEEFRVYNANTDPSVSRKNIAVLQPGVYKYAQGLHGRHHLDLTKLEDQKILHTLQSTGKDYPKDLGRPLPYHALIQSGPVTVLRDGATEPETIRDPDRYPMINIHRGGRNTTSSEGCQTIFPDYWSEFFWNNVVPLMEKYKVALISYALLEKK